MILEEFLSKNDDSFLDYAEINLGGDTKNYSTQSFVCEIPPDYLAANSQSLVPILGVDGVSWVSLGIKHGSIQREIKNNQFPIHPLEWENQIKSERSCEIIGYGTPLSNIRTLHIKNEITNFQNAGFIKLSVPKRISRFDRKMHSYDIIHEVACTAQLEKLGRPFLPSYGGGYLEHEDGSTTGFIIRPQNLINCKKSYRFIPLFSLYGHDTINRKDSPLLTQFIHNQNEKPVEFVIHNIVSPIIRLWIDSINECGLLLSLHGQNSLVCIDENGRIADIGFRGTHSFVFPEVKHQIPELLLYSRCIVGEEQCRPFNEVASLLYDCFLGNHVFSFIEKLLYKDFGVNPSAFQDAVKSTFKECGGLELPMSQGVYYYPSDFYGNSSTKLKLDRIAEKNIWR